MVFRINQKQLRIEKVQEPLIKICGLSTPETLKTAIDARADWVGLVTFEPSPRHVDPLTAGELAAEFRGQAKFVSLSVNADDDLLQSIFDHLHPDIFQFHGKEPPARIEEIKARYKIPVMRAIGVSTIEDLDKINPYIGVADYILLDAKPPKGALLPGGNGAAFDWAILDHLPEGVKFMLSGGLTPDNVGLALEMTMPFGVDVSSGVESAPGNKDPDLIRQFVNVVRA